MPAGSVAADTSIASALAGLRRLAASRRRERRPQMLTEAVRKD